MKKTLFERMKELEDCLMLLDDSYVKIQEGSADYYFRLISTLLRSLLTQNSPLLLNILTELNKNIECYGPREILDSELSLGLKFSSVGKGIKFISSKKQSPVSQRYDSLEKWVNSKIIVLTDSKNNSHAITPSEIIQLSAGKDGIAHFPNEIPSKLLALKSVIYHDENSYHLIHKLFLDISEFLVIEIGDIIVRYINNNFSHNL